MSGRGQIDKKCSFYSSIKKKMVEYVPTNLYVSNLTFDSKGFDLPLTVKMPPWEDGLKKQCLSIKLPQTS